MRLHLAWGPGLFVLMFLSAGALAQDVQVIADFEGDSAWTAHPADGVLLDLSQEAGETGHSLRLDYVFTGGGYAIARLATDLVLPDNYAFRFRIRGAGPDNHLEFKLVDPSGENVWWHVQRDVVWPAEWTVMRLKKRQIGFAWGPQDGGEIERVAAIEFAITASA
ncbi:MAG: discoidin domain-containing protein, partial [Candidatus Krumholzibacteria bacterium]|nr:discoidin domain-containing protein [Candidatus Krumholzibacteria bacterium]